ncbi:LysR family transcriptional regulator [Campylobacter hyointestinalis]|nr:LysR family transcriptional regulator [Campylobacter hyointestinalis]
MKTALSNSIKELEKSLNGLLFDRNLILNQKGKAFLKMITPI